MKDSLPPANKSLAWIYGGYVWIVFATILLFFGGLVILVNRRPLGRQIAHVGARLLFFAAGIPLSSKGLDRLPARPHILLVNHSSFLDGLALSALLPPRPGYAFVVKQQFKSQRLLCPLLNSLGTIVLNRLDGRRPEKSRVAMLTSASAGGEYLIVFPEGAFSPEPGIKAFHSGVFFAAAYAKSPIVVAGLRGARDILRPGTWLPRRGSLTLEIGPVLMPGASDVTTVLRERDAARKATIALSGEPASSKPAAVAGVNQGGKV